MPTALAVLVLAATFANPSPAVPKAKSVSVTLDVAGAEAVRRFGYVKRVHEDTPVSVRLRG